MLQRNFMTATELGITPILYDTLQTVLYKLEDGQIVGYSEFCEKVVKYDRAQPRGLKKLFSWFIKKPDIPLPPRYVIDMGCWFLPGKYLGQVSGAGTALCKKYLVGAGCIYGLARAFSGDRLPESFRDPMNIQSSMAGSRLCELFLGVSHRYVPTASVTKALRSYLETGKASW